MVFNKKGFKSYIDFFKYPKLYFIQDLLWITGRVRSISHRECICFGEESNCATCLGKHIILKGMTKHFNIKV